MTLGDISKTTRDGSFPLDETDIEDSEFLNRNVGGWHRAMMSCSAVWLTDDL